MESTKQRGLTLIELLVSLAIASMLLLSLHQLINHGFSSRLEVEQTLRMSREARFAMNRMVDAVSGGGRLLIPLSDIASTSLQENIRDTRVGVSSSNSAVLAVTLNPSIDLDENGIADADNDGDGLIDEDLPADTTNDGEPGVRGFDDDGNGYTDYFYSPAADDDESNDRVQNEDPINGIDDDGDGSVDEDPGSDNNGDNAPGILGVDDDGDGSIDEGSVNDDDEDGLEDEDWYDPVVFYLRGSNLIERRPVPWDENGDGDMTGRDYVESVVAQNISYLKFERVVVSPLQQQLVSIDLEISNESGGTFSLSTTVRLGAAQ